MRATGGADSGISEHSPESKNPAPVGHPGGFPGVTSRFVARLPETNNELSIIAGSQKPDTCRIRSGNRWRSPCRPYQIHLDDGRAPVPGDEHARTAWSVDGGGSGATLVP